MLEVSRWGRSERCGLGEGRMRIERGAREGQERGARATVAIVATATEAERSLRRAMCSVTWLWVSGFGFRV